MQSNNPDHPGDLIIHHNLGARSHYNDPIGICLDMIQELMGITWVKIAFQAGIAGSIFCKDYLDSRKEKAYTILPLPTTYYPKIIKNMDEHGLYYNMQLPWIKPNLKKMQLADFANYFSNSTHASHSYLPVLGQLNLYYYPAFREFLKTCPEYDDFISDLNRKLNADPKLRKKLQDSCIIEYRRFGTKPNDPTSGTTKKCKIPLKDWINNEYMEITTKRYKQNQKATTEKIIALNNLTSSLPTQIPNITDALLVDEEWTSEQQAGYDLLNKLQNNLDSLVSSGLSRENHESIIIAQEACDIASYYFKDGDNENYQRYVERIHAALLTAKNANFRETKTYFIEQVVAEFIDINDYQQCSGTPLQHQLHHEILNLFGNTIPLHNAKVGGIHDPLELLWKVGDQAHVLNANNDVARSSIWVDCGWALLRGIKNAVTNTVQNAIDHPFATAGDIALCYLLPGVFIARSLISFAMSTGDLKDLGKSLLEVTCNGSAAEIVEAYATIGASMAFSRFGKCMKKKVSIKMPAIKSALNRTKLGSRVVQGAQKLQDTRELFHKNTVACFNFAVEQGKDKLNKVKNIISKDPNLITICKNEQEMLEIIELNKRWNLKGLLHTHKGEFLPSKNIYKGKNIPFAIKSGMHTERALEHFIKMNNFSKSDLFLEKLHNGVTRVILPREAFVDKIYYKRASVKTLDGTSIRGIKTLWPAGKDSPAQTLAYAHEIMRTPGTQINKSQFCGIVDGIKATVTLDPITKIISIFPNWHQ